MIIDLERFAAAERPYWRELEQWLDRLERDGGHRFDLAGAERFYYLYQRACADLSRLATFSAEPELRRHLERLVARAYGELHDSSREPAIPGAAAGGDGDGSSNIWRRAGRWFGRTFPQTVRRHTRALALAALVTLIGMAFGAFGLLIDEEAKEVMLPAQFNHLAGRPSERVAKEEARRDGRHLADRKATFSTSLMANNIRVSILTMSLGLTWGIGTIVELFYNGVILGAVGCDYVRDGQSVFLLGWLLPHGSVEIPSIVLAGQAGLMLGGAVIGWGRRERLRERLRAVAPDLATLIGGVAVLLVWAGVVEAFFSQYHEPVLPYALKIGFGVVQAVGLGVFLVFAGRERAVG